MIARLWLIAFIVAVHLRLRESVVAWLEIRAERAIVRSLVARADARALLSICDAMQQEPDARLRQWQEKREEKRDGGLLVTLPERRA